MPTETLVDRELEEGRVLLEAIGKSDLLPPPKAALWYFATEMDEWRLMIQFPLSEQFHHTRAFERIERIRRTFGADFRLPLRKIALQSQHSPLVSTVRRKLSKSSGPKEGFHYIGERVGVDFIEDVYVYFI